MWIDDSFQFMSIKILDFCVRKFHRSLPERNCMVPHISKTDWFFMKQKRRKETRQRRETMTASPTKTVDARKAGDKIDAKLSKRPTQRTASGSAPGPPMIVLASVELPELPLSARMVQNRQRPKWPGLFDVSVCPTHSSCRKTTIFKMAAHNVNTPHKMATDFEWRRYLKNDKIKLHFQLQP